jgi:hypothetical protein
MKFITRATACALLISGLAAADTINVPGDYASIAEAVDVATVGDVVQIEAGEYYEPKIEARENILITGAVNKDGSPAVTIRSNGHNTELMHVDNGWEGIEIENLIFADQVTSSNGGGLQLINSNGTFRNCVITGNTSTGGGAYFGQTGNVEFENCTFTDNHSTSHGGGLRCREASSIHFVDCVISGNTAFGRGGGIVLYNVNHVTFDGSLVTGNATLSSDEGGGGMYWESGVSDSLYLNDSEVSYNSAPVGGGIATKYGGVYGGEVFGNTANYGAGVFVWDGECTLAGMTIRDNIATFNGGGVYTAYDATEYPDVIATTVCGNTPNQIWHIEGDNTNIINESCSSNPAACCVNGACIMVEPLMCDDVGGTLSNGGEEDCSSTECAEPCLGDVNNDSEINVNDLLTVIANWGGCP